MGKRDVACMAIGRWFRNFWTEGRNGRDFRRKECLRLEGIRAIHPACRNRIRIQNVALGIAFGVFRGLDLRGEAGSGSGHGSDDDSNTPPQHNVPNAPTDTPHRSAKKRLFAAGTINTVEVEKSSSALSLFGIPIVGVSIKASESVVTAESALFYALGGTSTQTGTPDSAQGNVGFDIFGAFVEIGGSFGGGFDFSVSLGAGDNGFTFSTGLDSNFMITIGLSGDYTYDLYGNSQRVESAGGEIQINPAAVAAAIGFAFGIPPNYVFAY